MKTFHNLTRWNIAILLGMIFLASCQKDEGVSPITAMNEVVSPTTTMNSPTAGTGTYYGLSASNEIIRFILVPQYIELGVAFIKGLRPEEQIISIDVRPVNRALYGVSNQSRIYKIDRYTGYATPLSMFNFYPSIDGATIGFDFNPWTDRIILLSDKGQTLIIHPTTGQVVGKWVTNLTGINALAHCITDLYGISTNTDLFYGIDLTGNVKAIGSTGLTITGEGGLDFTQKLDPKKYLAIGVFNASGVVPTLSPEHDDLTEVAYRLYAFDLQTGQASSLGRVKPMIGLSVQ